MTIIIRKFCLVPLLLFICCSSYSDPAETKNDSIILAAVRYGNTEILAELFRNEKELDRKYGEEERTLLPYSIENNQLSVTEYLLDIGFNVEKKDENKTPLMFAAKYGRDSVVRSLIDHGAEINAINSFRNTAFHYAAKYNKPDILKLLYEKGANINIPNEDQWTALDYAIINNNQETVEYLESIGCIIFNKIIPDYFDGPYIDILNEGDFRVNYLVNRNGRKGSSILSRQVDISDTLTHIKGFRKDRNEYYINTNPTIPPCIYDTPSKIFVMGDIHGQYERMVEMLISGGVIDDKLNWSWGDGHLIFIGDIFDRGEGVMEAYWLIYKLEQQAENKNGKVHLIMGNHEAMILKNDIRYISNKYYSLTSNLGLSYHELFSENTVIGKWLKTKNVVEKVGNTLFIHAGISKELLSFDLSLEDINSGFRHFLNESDEDSYNDMDRFLIGRFGPVWYRGYLKASSGYNEIDQQSLEEVLETYSADQVVVGHTEVNLIQPVKNKKVYPVNIPLANRRIIGQGLLIENRQFYRVTTENKKTKLN
ncbi:MAG TPA: hypothetical protein DEQ09_04880 [Bacteroidales bacterium]|nr:hypothetical protein [Bacteroidales bacterium]